MIKQRVLTKSINTTLNKLRKAMLNILLLASVSFATTSLQATENHSNYTSTYKDNKSLMSDSRQVDCLVSNAYHESRNQGEKGILATVFVVLNRTKDSRFPSTPCKVIAQPNQFEWVGKGKVIKEKEKYQEIKQLVIETLKGEHRDLTKGSLYFHNTSIKPSWSKKLNCTIKIKDHVFYK